MASLAMQDAIRLSLAVLTVGVSIVLLLLAICVSWFVTTMVITAVGICLVSLFPSFRLGVYCFLAQAGFLECLEIYQVFSIRGDDHP